MKKLLYLIIILSVKITGQIVEYEIAPLSHINNYWLYEDKYLSGITITSIKIIDTAKYVDSIKYFEAEIDGSIKRLYRLREDGFYVMRRDTSYPEPYHEQIYYKKGAQIGDKWKTRADGEPPILNFTLVDTTQAIVFGRTITIKLLNIKNEFEDGTPGLLDKDEVWSEEFGMLLEDHGEGFTDNLEGCIINNIIYGDTSLTSVSENKIIPFDYNLSQNYPNPFNPETNISFQIPEFGLVQIRVYDILGREVSALLNEEKEPGMHNVRFDGSRFASGVYFYNIISGKYSQTKK